MLLHVANVCTRLRARKPLDHFDPLAFFEILKSLLVDFGLLKMPKKLSVFNKKDDG